MFASFVAMVLETECQTTLPQRKKATQNNFRLKKKFNKPKVKIKKVNSKIGESAVNPKKIKFESNSRTIELRDKAILDNEIEDFASTVARHDELRKRLLKEGQQANECVERKFENEMKRIREIYQIIREIGVAELNLYRDGRQKGLGMGVIVVLIYGH